MLSKEGQEVVVKDGYMPLTAARCKQELAKITGAAGTSSAGSPRRRRDVGASGEPRA